MRRIAIEDFRYLTGAARQGEGAKPIEQSVRPWSVEAQIGRDKWAEQPGPDRSLVISRIPIGG